MPIDPDLLAASIERLERREPADVEPLELLRQVVDAAADLFGVDGVGLMFLDEDKSLRYVDTTDLAAATLERAQQEVGEGPCLDSLVLDAVVIAEDLARDERYRALAPLVVPHGVAAVLGLPVRVGGAAVGTLNAYHREPHAWEPSEINALRAYVRLLEALLDTIVAARRQGRIAEQLQFALDHRIVIERSIGYLMAQRNVGAVAAFDLLRRAARSRRCKVSEIAAEILGGAPDG